MPKNELVLYGTVGGSGWWDDGDYFDASSVRDSLDGLTGELTVRINSGGGIASEGQAIYTMLRDYSAEHGKVHIVVDAVAMSAASLIAMAGDTRTMRLGSYLLIHDPATPWSEGRGTEDDHRKTAEMLKVVSSAYAEIYAQRAGITRAEAREIMRAETIYDSEAALAAGFATATEADPAVEAAVFDYRIFSHAPKDLRDRSASLGKAKGNEAVMAMFAGRNPRATQEGLPMPGDNKAAGGPADNQDERRGGADGTGTGKPDGVGSKPGDAERVETDDGQGDGATRRPDPYETPERPPQAPEARERARQRRIRDAARAAGYPVASMEKLLDDGVSLEVALDRINAAWKAKGDDDSPMFGQRTNRVGTEAREKFAKGAELALLAKVGLKGGERNEFSSMSLAEMARESIIMSGNSVRMGASRLEMIGQALTMVGQHTTGDLPNVLGNVAGRSLLRGWEEAAEQIGLVTGDAFPLTDFKPVTQTGLGFFDTLAEIPEGAEYKYGTFGDRAQTLALATYGRLFAITRQAIINDDLGVLGEVPRKMGRAARRTVGNLVWGVFTSNPVLADGIALFHASHNNLLTGGTSALSIASLQAAVTLMRTQTAEGLTVGVQPARLVVPAALEFTAREILESAVYPAVNRGQQANPVRNIVSLVVEPRLDRVSAVQWYLIADPNAADVIRLGYLDGVEEPFLDSRENWGADGREFKVRIDAGVAPGDFRAVVKSNGV